MITGWSSQGGLPVGDILSWTKQGTLGRRDYIYKNAFRSEPKCASGWNRRVKRERGEVGKGATYSVTYSLS